MSPMEAVILSFEVELKIFSFEVKKLKCSFFFYFLLFCLKLGKYFKGVATEKVFCELKMKVWKYKILLVLIAMAADQVEEILTCKRREG